MKTSLDFLAAIAERLGWALLHSLWQGALIAAALALALHFLRRQRAATRHAVSMVAMMLLVTSVVGRAWLTRPAAVSAQAARDQAVAEPAAAPDRLDSATVVWPEKAATKMSAWPAPVGAVRSWRGKFAPLLPWISAAWVLGVALLTLRHWVGWRRMGRMRRNGTNARPELQRTFTRLLGKVGRAAGVRLLESAEATVPMLAGLFKPAVLLPLRVISGLSEQEIEAILAHELAHLVRRDAWSNLTQVAIETLLFYHPAMWWIGRCARQERENAADDLALEICEDRRVYAGALAQLAELRFASQSALAATGGSLLARIRRIVRPALVETPASGWSLGLPALFTALALAAIFRTQAEQVKPPDAAPNLGAKNVAQETRAEAEARIEAAFQSILARSRHWAASADALLPAQTVEQRKMGFTFGFEPVAEPDSHTIDLSLVPQVVEFEGFINYGSPITAVSPAFNAAGTQIGTPTVITSNVLNQSIFNTRKVTTSISIFDGQTVLLGGLVREDLQTVADAAPETEGAHPVGVEAEAKVAGQATAAASLAAEKPVADQTLLNVAADGSILLNEKVISLEQLSEKLKALTKQFPDHSVVLRYNDRPDYMAVQAILKVCEEAKVWKIAFGPVVEPVGQAPVDRSIVESNRAEVMVNQNRQKARLRAADDRQTYQAAELSEIESLYQVANKNWRSKEARTSLKKLLEKFDHANRTGCATLYMGQMSEGTERLEYLTRAVEKFSDCYYFNGCQVGGYGRYVLALTLWDKGEKEKARALLAELKTSYREATDHKGRPMGEVAEAVEKELAPKE